MAVQNSYTVNGAGKKTITGGFADIEMSTEDGVKAGCREFPIPLLNKITVESRNGAFSKSTTIYAGYKIVEQMLGKLVASGNYNPNTPNLNTIIESGRFGIFEPAHYDSDSGRWVVNHLSETKIQSLINLGTGIKICVKIEYTKSNASAATVVYVDISGASTSFDKITATNTPYYTAIGGLNLPITETVERGQIINAAQRTWFESVLTHDILDIDLNSSITDPDTTQNMTVTLMAYIGDLPTANNTFPILKMTTGSVTSVTVPFETYEPTIAIFNADQVYNPDTYADGYGSVAEYNVGTSNDTTISISIVAPE